MNHIITISRQFGSGGREVGRRLAENLHIAYYDREILSEIVRRTELTEHFVRQVIDQPPMPLMPITIARSFYLDNSAVQDQAQSIFRQQSEIITELAAQSDCVIVGRCADYILRDLKPFNIFVCAALETRMARCRARAGAEESLSDRELKKRINSIDKGRRRYYEYYTGRSWGDPLNYDLCINTSTGVIRDITGHIAQLFN